MPKKDVEEEAEGKLRRYKGPMAWGVKIFSATIPLYSIFYLLNTSYFNIRFYQGSFLAFFLALIMTLVFLLYPATKKAPRDRLPWYDLLLILVGLVPTLYECYIYREIAEITKVGATTLEQILFIILILVLFEAVRRVAGLVILAVIAFFLAYAKFAYFLPGMWGAPRSSWARLTEYMYLYDSGIFGSILGMCAEILIFFVTFGAFLVISGVGTLMIDVAMALAGRYRGGPAKVAIVASGIMATMTGSAAANTGTVGPITIPLMKKVGYKDYFAGAVEAVAGTGGIITPPVMGSIAFIMAQITGAGYAAVCVAAILPAFLYYLALYLQLDFEAAKLGLVGLPREQLPLLRKVAKEGWYLLLPVVLLGTFLVLRWDPAESVLYSIGAVIVLSWFKKENRIGLGKILDGLARGGQSVLVVAPIMGCVGIIFGGVTLTGLGVNLAALLLGISGNNLIVLGILTWIMMYIAGLGISESITYIIMSLLVAPAFIKLGMSVLAANMFIFLAGVSMYISPPNCPAVWVACSIAGSEMWRTGFQAMKLGMVAFLVPFILLFSPVLIMEGSATEIVVCLLTSVVALYFLAAAVEGYMLKRATIWQRIFFLAGGFCLFIQRWEACAIALLILLLPTLAQVITWRREKVSVPASA